MKFRYARSTKNIKNLADFYCEVLDFIVLGGFQNHDGYNGVFLGKNGENWHLEFTENGENRQSIFDEDDHLVFYPKEISEYNKIVENIAKFKIEILIPKNPYWQKNAVYFKDPDGFGIIISKEKI